MSFKLDVDVEGSGLVVFEARISNNADASDVKARIPKANAILGCIAALDESS